MSDVWQDIITTAETIRREFHANPEIGWQEYRTAQRVREILSSLNLAWRSCAGTGTVGILNPNGTAAPHIALRGDMDALPIHEATLKAWSSMNEGCMHACGHDGHIATLLATAKWLKYHEAQLKGPVSLIFQPAEEGGHGAREMIKDGALEGVDEIYGWHNWPAIPFGQLLCPDALVMCGNGTFKITLHGQGGHASQPELCRDPVLAASAITLNLQQIISRRLAPQQAAVISVTSIEAFSAPTVIPQNAVIGGSIRVPDSKTRDEIYRLISEISQHTATTYGVTAEVEVSPRYDATINHAVQAAQMRRLWQEIRGADSLDFVTSLPIMASEDFSYYLQHIPGAFALIGSDDGPDHQVPCHSPFYDFNDRLIPVVTRLFSRLVGVSVPVLKELP